MTPEIRQNYRGRKGTDAYYAWTQLPNSSMLGISDKSSLASRVLVFLTNAKIMGGSLNVTSQSILHVILPTFPSFKPRAQLHAAAEDVMSNSGEMRESPRTSHRARVLRIGRKLHFGWDNHAQFLLQNMWDQARVSCLRKSLGQRCFT